MFLRKDGLSLETPFIWGVNNMTGKRGAGALLRLLLTGSPKTMRAMSTVPLSRADVVATGRRVDYLQDILTHEARHRPSIDLAVLGKFASERKFATVGRVSDLGLRERKKAATRVALSEGAIRLAQERGVEQVTLDAIADAAGVSPRTFHNYFPNKEEAILAGMWDRVAELVAALRARPADESAWDASRHVAREVMRVRSDTVDQLVARRRLLENSPTLAVHSDAMGRKHERAVIEALAERAGCDPDRDLYPHLLAAALHVAISAATTIWRAGKTGRELTDLTEAAFDLIRAGLPEPSR